MKKTGIYCRVSKKSKNNVRMQLKICKNYCLNKKIKILKEYIDKGFSGRDLNRPALNELIKDIENKKINQVLLYKIDRLGRNLNNVLQIIEKFEKKNISLISATQIFDNSTPEGKFMLRMLILLAEFESNMISKRTIDGLSSIYKKRPAHNR